MLAPAVQSKHPTAGDELMNTHLSRTRLRVAGGLVTLAAVAVLGGTASAQAAGETSAVCAPTMSLTITDVRVRERDNRE